MSATGFPVILSAPSGSGKTTIAKALLDRRPDLGYSVSCTTRSPRPGEISGRDYYFMSRAEFIAERERDAFAESAVVHGNLYGTLRREVQRVLNEGKHVVMDIDVQGATQFMRAFPQSVTIFILPPSADILLDRLRSIIDAENVRRERVKNLRQQVAQLIERLELEIENTTP
jgi:guanylate kinase